MPFRVRLRRSSAAGDALSTNEVERPPLLVPPTRAAAAAAAAEEEEDDDEVVAVVVVVEGNRVCAGRAGVLPVVGWVGRPAGAL
jgi:hypothetical protein